MGTLSLLILAAAITFLCLASNRRRHTGLPGGRVIYNDTRGWGKLEKPLFDPVLDLTGRLDYLVEQGDLLIPVEVKTGRTPQAPYDSHIFQLAAYCLLVERALGKRPTRGIVKYPQRSFSVDYTTALEAALLDLLAEIRIYIRKRTVARSHDSPARCGGCGFRAICDQRI